MWSLVHITAIFGFTLSWLVVQDIESMQTMRTLGHNMAWILKCIEAGRVAGIERPTPEKQIKTNFIRFLTHSFLFEVL